MFRFPNCAQMATLGGETSRQYPPKIEALLRSMERTQVHIENLNEQLNTAKSEYNRLELEWEDYNASIAPIRTCPPEVLSIIFHSYLRENPRLVRRLLLVCKQWYGLVVSDPRMWNRISVTVPDEWDIESTTGLIERRIKCCLQRSGTLLLDLNLDLRNLRSAEDQIIQKFRMCLIDAVSIEDWNEMDDWFDDLDLQGLVKSPTTTTYLPDSMLKVVLQLVGNKGEVMARWGSLRLRLPESDMPLVMDIWQIFAWPAPNLSRMVIRCGGNMEQYEDKLAVGFPDISSLKHLDIFSTENLRFLKPEISSLEGLVIYCGVQDWNLIGLSRFTQLQRLEVSDFYWTFGEVERFTLHLPKLRHLILKGTVRDFDAVDFRVPVLCTLDLVRRDYSGFHALPELQSLHVRWKNKGVPSSWSPSILIVEMKIILLQFDKAVNLTIDEFARSALIKAVKSLYAKGMLPSALETIIVERPDGEETILVASLCRAPPSHTNVHSL